MSFNSSEGFALMTMNNNGEDSPGSKFREVIARASVEARKGVVLDFIPEVTIGRKAR